MTKPEPSELTRRGVSPPLGSPGPPRRFLKNSSKNSSNGEPGGSPGPGRASGLCPGPWRDEGPPAVTVWEVEMFTTASITASATSAILSGPRCACVAPIGNAIAAPATSASAPLRTFRKVPAMGVGAPKGQDSRDSAPGPEWTQGRYCRGTARRADWGGMGAEDVPPDVLMNEPG